MSSICIRCVQFLTVVGWITASSAIVLAIDWKANVDGNFNDGTRRNGNLVPGSGDTAQFSQGAAASYTVTFPGDLIFNPTRTYTNDRLVVDNNDVTFARSASHQLGPAKYALTNSTTTAGGVRGIVVGDLGDSSAILRTDLVSLSGVAATIGKGSLSAGTLVVNGGVVNIIGSSMIAGDTELIVGDLGKGVLSIENGGQVNLTGDAGDVLVGNANPGVFGDVLNNSINISNSGSLLSVQGANSKFTIRKGSLNITAGGQLTTSGTATILSNGVAAVDGTGSIWTASASGIALEGTSTQATLNVTGGGTVIASQVTSSAGTIAIDGAGSIMNANLISAIDVTLTHGGQVARYYDNGRRHHGRRPGKHQRHRGQMDHRRRYDDPRRGDCRRYGWWPACHRKHLFNLAVFRHQPIKHRRIELLVDQ